MEQDSPNANGSEPPAPERVETESAEADILMPDQLRRIALSMCRGKCGFTYRRDAKQRAKHLLGTGFPPTNIYPCPFCGRWHLTSHRASGDKAFYTELRERVIASLAHWQWKKEVQQ